MNLTEIYLIIGGFFLIAWFFLSLLIIWSQFPIRAKVLNLIFRKRHYGVKDTVERSGQVTPHLVDMTKDIQEEGERAFKSPSKVYRREGVPYIIYSYKDAVQPIILDVDQPEKYRDPVTFESIILQIKARAEAMAFIQRLKRIDLYHLIEIIGLLIILAFLYVIYNHIGDVLTAVKNIQPIIKGS